MKIAKRKNGTFKITRNKLTCSGVILDSRMAVPDKPPSSTPEGSRNSATPVALTMPATISMGNCHHLTVLKSFFILSIARSLQSSVIGVSSLQTALDDF